MEHTVLEQFRLEKMKTSPGRKKDHLDGRKETEADLGGKHEERNDRIVEQIPDQRIAWESEAGENSSGIVNIQAEGPNQTRVKLDLL
jgi:uncharacterized membrane protein